MSALIVYLFLHEYLCCGYSLEAPRRGASNEYPQHTFSWRNSTIFQLKKVPTLELRVLPECIWFKYNLPIRKINALFE